jgi:osmotically-inducible protein OsmY
MMRPVLMATLALILAAGCGMFQKETKPEDRLENAAGDLEQATEEREEARRQVAEAKARLERESTDVAITRAIQQKLLQDAELAELALHTQVSQGNVRLTGTVMNELQRQRAVQIAAGTPGVSGVTDEIRVGGVDSQTDPAPRQQ